MNAAMQAAFTTAASAKVPICTRPPKVKVGYRRVPVFEGALIPAQARESSDLEQRNKLRSAPLI